MPGHMLHEAQYYVVTVSAARCNTQYSFKTTRLKTSGSHLVLLKYMSWIIPNRYRNLHQSTKGTVSTAINLHCHKSETILQEFPAPFSDINTK